MERFIFNKDKSINAILYIANRLKKPDIHKVFKILYFSDLDSIREYGVPLTGDRYIAMHNGPVPSYIYDIIKVVRGDSYFSDMEGLSRLFSVEKYIIRPLVEADTRKFSPNNLEILNKNIEQYGSKTFGELTEKSHGHAWNNTEGDCEISISHMAEEAGLSPEEIRHMKGLLSERSFLCK